MSRHHLRDRIYNSLSLLKNTVSAKGSCVSRDSRFSNLSRANGDAKGGLNGSRLR
jgi:hypothetical protein